MRKKNTTGFQSRLKARREKKPAQPAETFEYTDEPLDAPEFMALPEAIKEEYHALLDLIKIHSEEAIEGCLNLVENYPQIAMFHNNLYTAYQSAGRSVEAHNILLKMRKQFPTYLFGLLNYITYLLNQERFEETFFLIDGKMDLHLMYPQRDLFQVSEVIAFYSVLGRFFAMIDGAELAMRCIAILEEVGADPSHIKRIELILDKMREQKKSFLRNFLDLKA